ncbi:pseudouridine-5'-phosphate glycosidase [Tumebacillus permanentifrigoris]|uniref:Pseudouridine-5'-phosphate glycosidase n=1 Tax=Tumebacillus permanentifrigoris TaxID=378543 RepID=A0A316DB22_9BACL|nr:pseudouridine-5'-phosphate glycosidase [Tumebacillus permanentifrigoris]PWK14928.1 pseudouridine-5'-phosphate glycosidase [Tumebacillus permanentifrigoris]
MQNFLDIHPDVETALREGRPVVALESTIISHGMPYPQNVQTAREVEAIIREQGATPATIGIIDGRIKIGLTDDELESFGQTSDVHKVSRRDLPYVVAAKKHGATTVAATMICAQLAGIRVFVTGGIGGVHREGELTMDISADLTELAQTDVAVICAGAKSILDLGRTLEYLETSGVPVIGYQTSDFPAFYTRQSGHGVDYRLDAPEEIASFLHTKWGLGLRGGAVIANPVPEAYAMPHEEMEAHIDNALAEAKAQGIKGKDATPFLLAKMKEITGGKSLETNIELVKNNALVGAQIAVAYANQK